MLRITRLMHCALALAACFFASAAAAQAYPTKTIRMILPFPPGGPTDLLGRAIAQKLSEQLGQQVVADNRPGAGGNLGLELAAKAPPDGYTVVLSSPLIALSPSLYARLNYEQKDLAPVSLVGEMQNVMVVHPSVPAKTVKEFVQLARANPGKLNFGSGGVGTTTHLAPELLKSLTRIDMVHVPFKGSGLALVALVSGQIDMLVMAAPAAAPQVKAGKARALVVVAPKRAAVLPDVPTAKEAGYENFEVRLWYGILAPAATPPGTISRLGSELNKALTSAELRERLSAAGIEPLATTPGEFAEFIRSETARYAKLVKDARIPQQ